MKYDVVAMGESVIDFTPIGVSDAGNVIYESQPGGAPSNMLAAVARLGGKAALIGLLGDDPLGESIYSTLQGIMIEVKGLCITQEAPTGLTIVKLDDEGERNFFSVQTKKSYELLSEKELNYELIDNARIFYIAGSMFARVNSLKAVETALEYIENKDILTCCDLNWRQFLFDKAYAQETILPILFKLNIIKLSHEELTLLLNTEDVVKGSAELLQWGVQLVVITLGAGGCYYCFAGGSGHVYSYRVSVKDTNAAGDAFTGAMLLRISKLEKDIDQISDEEMRDILGFANAAGATCASKPGALLAVPTLEEVEKTRRESPLLIPT